MAEAHDAQGALAAAERDADFFPLDDLPNDVLVSVFAVAAAEAPTWVRHTIPLVCKAWNELYCSQNASPLHETLEVDFKKEVKGAEAAAATAAAREGRSDPAAGAPPRPPVVHASRVIAWAQERAASVRKLHFKTRKGDKDLEDFSPEDFGALVAVFAPSLTEIRARFCYNKPYEKQLWKSLRTSVAPAGRLRSLHVKGIESALLESDLEPLAQLAGSLEELALQTEHFDEAGVWADYFDWDGEGDSGLSRFPESLCALAELRRLSLRSHKNMRALPAGISSLKKLEELVITRSRLSRLPKELGELSALTRLDLSQNERLVGRTPDGYLDFYDLKRWKYGGIRPYSEYGDDAYLFEEEEDEEDKKPPADPAFPAELGNMKSLRELSFAECGLRALPAFVGGLESLEVLDLYCCNDLQFDTPLDFLLEGCPRLRELKVMKDVDSGLWTEKSEERLRDFRGKLFMRSLRAGTL